MNEPSGGTGKARNPRRFSSNCTTVIAGHSDCLSGSRGQLLELGKAALIACVERPEMEELPK